MGGRRASAPSERSARPQPDPRPLGPLRRARRPHPTSPRRSRGVAGRRRTGRAARPAHLGAPGRRRCSPPRWTRSTHACSRAAVVVVEDAGRARWWPRPSRSYRTRHGIDAPTRPRRSGRGSTGSRRSRWARRSDDRGRTPRTRPAAHRWPAARASWRPICRWSSSSTTCGARRRARSLAVGALPAGTRRRPLRGRSSSRTDRTPIRAARARTLRQALRRGLPVPRRRVTRPRRHRLTPSTGASAEAKGRSLALMVDGAHVLTPRVLHYGLAALADLRARRSSPPRPGTSAPASRATSCARATTRRSRTRSSSRSPGRTTATGSSRSATSSATATGSTASGRATACSSPRVAARAGRRLRRGLRHAPAAATPTSTSTSGWRRRPTCRSSTILGEGSFHQMHGGTTTNLPDPLERRNRIQSYAKRLPGAPRSTVHGAREAHPLRRRLPRRVGQAVPGPAHDRDGLRGRPGARGHRRPGRAAGRPHRRRPARPLHQRLLPEPGLAGHDLAGAPRAERRRPTSSPTRRSWPRSAPTGSSRRAPRRRAGALPGHRSATCSGTDRSSASTSAAPTGPSTLASPTSRAGPTSPRPVRRSRDLVGDDPHALVVLGRRNLRDRARREFEAYAPAGAGRLLRGHRAHRAERVPDRRLLRSRPPRGPAHGS